MDANADKKRGTTIEKQKLHPDCTEYKRTTGSEVTGRVDTNLSLRKKGKLVKKA